MVRFLSVLALSLAINQQGVFGQSMPRSPAEESDFRKNLLPPESTESVAAGAAVPDVTVHGLKKPAIGAALSAVIPGAGECYADSWLKGTLFFAAEIALWIGYGHFSDEGRTWDDTFTRFADEHWSEPKYWVYMAGPGQANIAGVDVNNYQQYLDQLRIFEKENYTHGLHLVKDQQYYEMIGKYNQFHAGWDDFEEGKPILTPNRDEYDGMRYKSNKAFKNASACAMGVLLNHVLSSLDAGWTIRSGNRKIQTGLRTEWKPDPYGGMPVVSFEIAWQ
jgi:hypothetical protein